jgi:Leucine-rich repeat (LRR) protein
MDRCNILFTQLQTALNDSDIRYRRSIQAMTFADNDINGFVDFSPFHYLTNLKLLDLRRNNIQSVSVHNALSIKELNLHDNSLRAFPQSCSLDGVSMFPELEYLDITYNKFDYTWTNSFLLCFPKLKILDMSGNALTSLANNFLVNFPKLQKLYIIRTL